MTTAFEDAVRAVWAGRRADEVAHELYDRLGDDERLWLLDGDEGFWQGLTRFRTEGYNRQPIVHGAVDRLGQPSPFARLDARQDGGISVASLWI